jgi:uncharacterized membrane protein required for colicin V production
MMGLDLALGVLVLLAALRGWLKGFILQAIRLAGLVGCVYAADPVLTLTKPYVQPHLPSIQPELLDRMLWWGAAAACYVVLVGVATSIHKVSKRQAFGIAEPKRNDQYAGFALGALKGLIAALFLTAGFDRYVSEHARAIAWAQPSVESSMMLHWNAQYQPAARIWASIPVQHFVSHVHRMGIAKPGSTTGTGSSATEAKPLQAASGQTPRLGLPSTSTSTSSPALDTSDLDPELARAVEAMKSALSRQIPQTAPAPAPAN